MAYNTKNVISDSEGNIVPQYYNPITDKYEVLEGLNGANKVVIFDELGNELISNQIIQPIVDKLSELTGTAIDENTRKSNEVTRKSNEVTRIADETTRKSAEVIRSSNEASRITSEDTRTSSESTRVTKEADRVSKESVRVSSEATRVSNEDIRMSNEILRGSNENVRVSNEDARVLLYNDIHSKLTSGYFKGEKGNTGNGLEYQWVGTSLGIRVVGDTNYIYVDLKGEKGETGSIDSLTSTHVTTALGYTPINENRVLTNVPLNAKFTDTITTINSKTGVITKADIVALGIPSTDTNTITTINGKTGTILKADIVALGVPAQDTVYTHPTGTNPHGTTKSDVGLGDVTNDKQMPISSGVLENYREKLVALSGTSIAINLSLGNVFTHTLSGNTTYSITNAVNSEAHSFTLIITQTATVSTIAFPASVKWQGGEIPDMTTANKTYILVFSTINGGTTWFGNGSDY